jgi:broad specificity phosphatase PhoE
VLTLVLTRHGLTTRSHPEQHLGQTIDVPLSDDGRIQAAALALRLKTIEFGRIVSSPLVRARQTADAVAATAATTGDGAAPRPRVETDARLMEMDYGAWEGLTYAEIDAHGADLRRRWEADPASRACPGGESGDDVADRVRSWLESLLDEDDGPGHGGAPDAIPAPTGEPPVGRAGTSETVLAVAHSTLNRVLLCVALGIPIREFRDRIVQSQVNLTVLQWEPGARPESARLLLMNDVAHVRTASQVPWE